ncbi:hypothetical protein ZHAS_00021855 [Anopheles sinensis]|uniref:Uncharacterized protein n=1 Tax=Anopheles sinensis TaxID=74873 RepID=A0A084WTS1_ANOSI|nr:hypothetical protein ZHAS_00021855 [Anopheles sinensis]
MVQSVGRARMPDKGHKWLDGESVNGFAVTKSPVGMFLHSLTHGSGKDIAFGPKERFSNEFSHP